MPMQLLPVVDYFSNIDLPTLWASVLAQNPTSSTPSPSSAADLELLKSQLEFLKQSQSQFIDAMKIIFTVLGIAGAAVAYFFGKSFKDFQDAARRDVKDFQEFSRGEMEAAIQRVRQEAEAQIPRLVETEVGDLIRNEVATVKRTLRREQVIGATVVDYFLPDGTDEPKEVELLRARKFKRVHFCGDIQSIQNFQRIRRSPTDVVILDLVNHVTAEGQAFITFQGQDREDIAQPLIDHLLDVLSPSTVIIVYVGFPPLKAVNTAPSDRYVIAANNPITLVGNAADGAYVVVGDRQLTS
ncbi:MAG: hypothetical protein WBA57_06135 [Elainellaceae cyanobacterium]